MALTRSSVVLLVAVAFALSVGYFTTTQIAVADFEGWIMKYTCIEIWNKAGVPEIGELVRDSDNLPELAASEVAPGNWWTSADRVRVLFLPPLCARRNI
jgi:hypothetical protein